MVLDVFVSLIKINLGYVSRHPTPLMAGSEMELKRFWPQETVRRSKCHPPLCSRLTWVPVPVILVLTKFDALVSKAGLDIPSGDPQHHGRARAGAHAMYEDLCRRTFHKEPRDVPAEIVSGIYSSFPYFRTAD